MFWRWQYLIYFLENYEKKISLTLKKKKVCLLENWSNKFYKKKLYAFCTLSEGNVYCHLFIELFVCSVEFSKVGLLYLQFWVNCNPLKWLNYTKLVTTILTKIFMLHSKPYGSNTSKDFAARCIYKRSRIFQCTFTFHPFWSKL